MVGLDEEQVPTGGVDCEVQGRCCRGGDATDVGVTLGENSSACMFS